LDKSHKQFAQIYLGQETAYQGILQSPQNARRNFERHAAVIPRTCDKGYRSEMIYGKAA
jgi:hypothetical protein